MRKLRVFLCEDEELSAKVTRLVLEEHMKKKKIEVDILYRSHYQEEQDELFKNVDLAILDIDLGEGELNGIELAKKMQKVNQGIVIIFITSHEDYALSAAQVHLSGFLAKPLNLHDFQDALDKALIQVNGFLVTKQNSKVAKFSNGRILIKEKDILSLEKIAHTREIEVITTKDPFRVNEMIKDMEERLSDCFIKVNRSVIVNMNFVFQIEKDTIVLYNRKTYPIATRQRKKVQKAFHEFCFNR